MWCGKAYMYRNEDIFGLYAESGFDCISWYDLDLHFTAPNLDLERNACRNANLSPSWGEGKPWCFTMVIWVVEFPREGYKFRKIFGKKSILLKAIIVFCELT